MTNKRGRWAKPIPNETKNKMITLRMDGDLYNALQLLSHNSKTSLNKLCLDILYRDHHVNANLGATNANPSEPTPLHSEATGSV